MLKRKVERRKLFMMLRHVDIAGNFDYVSFRVFHDMVDRHLRFTWSV